MFALFYATQVHVFYVFLFSLSLSLYNNPISRLHERWGGLGQISRAKREHGAEGRGRKKDRGRIQAYGKERVRKNQNEEAEVN